MDNRVFWVLGIALTGFLVGAAILSPLASGAEPVPAARPPPFQVLANNLQPASEKYAGSWIGGVKGYSTVTIYLSNWCVGPTACRSNTPPVDVAVYFQTGSTITDPLQFTWSILEETSIQTLTYTVPSDAETITILTAGMSPWWTYSIAILLSDPVSYSANYAAVGGIVLPANTFADISPWLAVIGLVGCIGALVLVAKKRQS